MRFRVFLLLGWLFSCSVSALADERVSICFNYGCITQHEAVYSEEQLNELRQLFAGARDAMEERVAISSAIGRMLGWAGKQTPIAADRGGNYADQSVYGRMDCIDHSTTTTRLLRMLEQRGFLRHHRVLEPIMRQRYLVLIHFSAQVEESRVANEGELAQRFVVDSWYFDNGQPAVVMPLARWLAGDDPNDVD